MEISSGTRVTEIRAVALPVAIVLMDVEVGTASFLAVDVALAVRVPATARAWALGHDARGCLLLPREVSDGRARVVIRVGHVDEVIGRVNSDLEKVSKAAVGAAKKSAG